MRIEVDLAEPNALRGHLYQFIIRDISEGFFQRHLQRRGQAHGFIRPGGAYV